MVRYESISLSEQCAALVFTSGCAMSSSPPAAAAAAAAAPDMATLWAAQLAQINGEIKSLEDELVAVKAALNGGASYLGYNVLEHRQTLVEREKELRQDKTRLQNNRMDICTQLGQQQQLQQSGAYAVIACCVAPGNTNHRYTADSAFILARVASVM